MSSRTLTKRRDFLGIIIWEILPGLFVSETVAVLSPFILGYALYRWLVGWGVKFDPQSAYFLIGMVTAVIDETIQYYVGRGSMVTDVWIDTAGCLLGCMIVMSILKFSSKNK